MTSPDGTSKKTKCPALSVSVVLPRVGSETRAPCRALPVALLVTVPARRPAVVCADEAGAAIRNRTVRLNRLVAARNSRTDKRLTIVQIIGMGC